MTRNIGMTPIEQDIFDLRLKEDPNITENLRVEVMRFYQDTHYFYELHKQPDPQPKGLKTTLVICIYKGNDGEEEKAIINRVKEIIEKNYLWNIAESKTIKRVRYDYSGDEGGDNEESFIKQLAELDAHSILRKLGKYDSASRIVISRLIDIEELKTIKKWGDIIALHNRDDKKLYFYTGSDDPFAVKLQPYDSYIEV